MLSKRVEIDENFIGNFRVLLDAINETTRDEKNLERVTIVTLNHDLLIETLLEKHRKWKPGANFEDGFGPTNDGVRRYDSARLFDDSARIRLIKPHGSINWYFDENGFVALTATDSNPNQIRRKRFSKSEPSFLSGIGKEESYHTGIFGDMVEAFQRSLRQTNIVIESGFGWQDYGMCSVLMRYLNRSESNRLLPLHPKDGLPNTLFDAPEYFRPDGIVRNPCEYMCDTSWKDVKKALGLPESEET